jgi:hypothetical protein
MKKFFTFLLAGALFSGVQAQVTITYKVDVTNYDTANIIAANGVRIGGNFAATSGSNGSTAMVNWSPKDASCAMTDEGGGVWAISVTYPAESVGTEQLFKFVNGDWGTNEGAAGSNIATDSCGLDDGSGNINRSIMIPDFATTYMYCWEQCTQCDGADATLSVNEVATNNMLVFPNPFRTEFTVSASNNSAIAQVTIMDLSGRIVASVAGQRRNTIAISGEEFGMVSGLYLVKVTAVDGSESLVKVSAL